MSNPLDLPRDEEQGDEGDSWFSVRLLDRDGKPVAKRQVMLGFTSPFRGIARPELSDEHGVATFVGYRDGEAKVFIGDRDAGTYYFAHGVLISIII